jgi:uncharacterized membrane-anchored protein YhcB (DUF1043 family)
MHPQKPKRSKLTLYIGIALVLGILAGFLMNRYYVGDENERIAFAELRLQQNTSRLKNLRSSAEKEGLKELEGRKKAAESARNQAQHALLNDATSAKPGQDLLFWTDSIKRLNTQIATLFDTTLPAYQQLLQEKTWLISEKSAVVKSRDKKTLSDDDMYDEDFDEEIEEDLPEGNNYAEEHDQAAYSNHIGASGQAITVS